MFENWAYKPALNQSNKQEMLLYVFFVDTMARFSNTMLVAINNIAIKYGYKPFDVHEIYTFCNIESEDRYDCFKIPKRNNQYRTIYAPKARLKSFLRCANIFFNQIYSPSDCVCGFVKGRSIIDNAIPHLCKDLLFCIDIKNFFPSTTIYSVCNSVMKHYGSVFNINDISLLVMASCVNFNSIPCLAQGSPLSPILSNIACIDLDNDIKNLCDLYDVSYSRYADDITFSSNRNIFYDDFKKSVYQILMKYGYKTNHHKTRLIRKGNRHKITGIIANEKINVPREYIKDLRNVLYIWDSYGIRNAEYAFKKKYKVYRSHINLIDYLKGKLTYLQSIKGKNDSNYIKLMNKYSELVFKEYPKDKNNRLIINYFKEIEEDKDCNAFFDIGIYGYALISPKLYPYIKQLMSKIDKSADKYCDCMGMFSVAKIKRLYSNKKFNWLIWASNHDMKRMSWYLETAYRRAGMKRYNKGDYQNAKILLSNAISLGNTKFLSYYENILTD